MKRKTKLIILGLSVFMILILAVLFSYKLVQPKFNDFSGIKFHLKVIPAWDWENWNPTLVFTGMDQEGTVLWGKKQIENKQ